MELTFLGTGAGVPAKTRNVTAIALQLLDERSVWWLFDCGEATQHQLLKSSLKPGKIEKNIHYTFTRRSYFWFAWLVK